MSMSAPEGFLVEVPKASPRRDQIVENVRRLLSVWSDYRVEKEMPGFLWLQYRGEFEEEREYDYFRLLEDMFNQDFRPGPEDDHTPPSCIYEGPSATEAHTCKDAGVVDLTTPLPSVPIAGARIPSSQPLKGASGYAMHPLIREIRSPKRRDCAKTNRGVRRASIPTGDRTSAIVDGTKRSVATLTAEPDGRPNGSSTSLVKTPTPKNDSRPPPLHMDRERVVHSDSYFVSHLIAIPTIVYLWREMNGKPAGWYSVGCKRCKTNVDSVQSRWLQGRKGLMYHFKACQKKQDGWSIPSSFEQLLERFGWMEPITPSGVEFLRLHPKFFPRVRNGRWCFPDRRIPEDIERLGFGSDDWARVACIVEKARERW